MKTVRTIATMLVLAKWLVVLALLSSMTNSRGEWAALSAIVTALIVVVLVGIWHRPRQ